MKILPLKKRIPVLLERLEKLYPEVESELNTSNPYEKVVATILSAQCTDKRVNMVTPKLFAAYPTVYDLAEAKTEDVEKIIKSTGFYRNKTKNIIGMARKTVEEFGGEIPKTMEELVSLPGVARKTANCVLADCYNDPAGIVVDTHVARLSIRLGLTKAPKNNAVKIEKDLMKIIPRDYWITISHRLIYHGRRVCNSRKPACGECTLLDICPYGLKKTSEDKK